MGESCALPMEGITGMSMLYPLSLLLELQLLRLPLPPTAVFLGATIGEEELFQSQLPWSISYLDREPAEERGERRSLFGVESSSSLAARNLPPCHQTWSNTVPSQNTPFSQIWLGRAPMFVHLGYQIPAHVGRGQITNGTQCQASDDFFNLN